MKINILIEQLILDGLPITQRDGATVQKAIESELCQLLEQNGLGSALQSNIAMPSAPPGSIQVGNVSNPNRLGHQIAESVHESLNKA